MAKLTTVFMLALLLFFTLTYAARPDPSLVKTQHGGVEGETIEVDDEGCEGVEKEECLMRRTLAAHIDYIYTQKHKP